MKNIPAEDLADDGVDTVNIVGLVVQFSPNTQESVCSQLLDMPGVELHVAENGQAVVTIDEQESRRKAVDTITDINHLPGVLSTSVAYHHFDQELVTQEHSL